MFREWILGQKKSSPGQGRFHRGTTQIDQRPDNKKRYRTGANCRGTTLLRTIDPLNTGNVGGRRGLLSVQPAVREGTSACFLNRLAPTAGSLMISQAYFLPSSHLMIYNSVLNYGGRLLLCQHQMKKKWTEEERKDGKR